MPTRTPTNVLEGSSPGRCQNSTPWSRATSDKQNGMKKVIQGTPCPKQLSKQVKVSCSKLLPTKRACSINANCFWYPEVFASSIQPPPLCLPHCLPLAFSVCILPLSLFMFPLDLYSCISTWLLLLQLLIRCLDHRFKWPGGALPTVFPYSNEQSFGGYLVPQSHVKSCQDHRFKWPGGALDEQSLSGYFIPQCPVKLCQKWR